MSFNVDEGVFRKGSVLRDRYGQLTPYLYRYEKLLASKTGKRNKG